MTAMAIASLTARGRPRFGAALAASAGMEVFMKPNMALLDSGLCEHPCSGMQEQGNGEQADKKHKSNDPV